MAYVMTLTWFIRYIYYWNLQFLNHIITNETKVLRPQAYVPLADFGYTVYALWIYCSQNLFGSQISILSVPDECYSRDALCALYEIATLMPR